MLEENIETQREDERERLSREGGGVKEGEGGRESGKEEGKTKQEIRVKERCKKVTFHSN